MIALKNTMTTVTYRRKTLWWLRVSEGKCMTSMVGNTAAGKLGRRTGAGAESLHPDE